MNSLTFFLLFVVSLINTIFWNMIFRSEKSKNNIRKIQKFLLSDICLIFNKIGFSSAVFTLLNLIFGIMSAYFLLNKEFGYFFVFFVLSIISDSFDGLMAKITRKTSEFWGKMDIIIDGSVRMLILLSFFMLYKFQILIYGVLSHIISVIIFLIRPDIRPKFLLVEPLIILALFFPEEPLTLISLSFIINLVIITISIVGRQK